MAKIMERNVTHNIWILDTPMSLILSVCVATYCKTCLILKERKKNHIFFLWNTGSVIWKFSAMLYTADLHLSRLIGMVSHPDMQKNLDNRFLFENRLHWQFEIWLLLFTVYTCVWTFRLCLIWSSLSHNTVLYLI
jgi:hypothetical protein